MKNLLIVYNNSHFIRWVGRVRSSVCENFKYSSVLVPDAVCFAFVYHTNMDPLSNSSTRSLISYAIFSQTGQLRRVDYLDSLGEYRREVSFSRTPQYIAQFRNQIKSRQLCDYKHALLSTELHRRQLE